MSDVTCQNLTHLSEALTRRELSSLDLLHACLSRIERLNPTLNIFRHVDLERAESQAKASDARRDRLGPLDGIPVAAKENIDIEGLITRSGLGPRDERPAKQDAGIIGRLRAAGAVILGHTAMHEGALGATNDNPHSGRTHNPWRLGHTPGGSSGGSAAAIAASFCPLALGTDTMGSIRLPAAYCGVAGHKPSRSAIGNEGIEPLYAALDQVGPIARSIDDLRLAFTALTSSASELQDIDLRRLRLAHLSNIQRVDITADVGEAFDQVLKNLCRMGADMREVTIDDYDPAGARRAGLLLAEAEASDHFRSDRGKHSHAFSESFAELLDYGERADGERLRKAKAMVEQVGKAMETLFEQVDLLLMPTAPQTAFSFDEPAPSNQADLTALANFAGASAVSLPVTLDREGLPIGLQVLGPRGSDDIVLAAAAALEASIDFQLPKLPEDVET